MITVKASQKIFACEEVVNLTGICAEHLQNLAKRHHLGFLVPGAESTGNHRWLFDRWDLMVLARLFPGCSH
jgi:hypothetical protein